MIEEPRDRFTWEDDTAAWKYLKNRAWIEESFVLRHPYPDSNRIPDCEWAAAAYLVQEWDWAFNAAPRY